MELEWDIEQQRHREMSSGLSRYQSAPSSYFTSLVDRKFCEQFVSRPSSPETERIFARFMTGGSGSGIAAEADRRKTLYLAPTVKSEAADGIQKQSDVNNYTSGLHQNEWKWKPPLPKKSIHLGREPIYYSMEMGGNCSLVRQSSSPAELVSHMENGLASECWEEGDCAMFLGDVKTSACHLSLPYSKSGAVVELSDSVPCKIRAKRGCATHPRSIAERVRRTRISERMRKLQQLVPNMDKQANTSEMLDLAIEYIKGLQKQVQRLSNNHESCGCSNKQKQLPQH